MDINMCTLYRYVYMEDVNVNVVQHKYEASISNYIIKNKKNMFMSSGPRTAQLAFTNGEEMMVCIAICIVPVQCMGSTVQCRVVIQM